MNYVTLADDISLCIRRFADLPTREAALRLFAVLGFHPAQPLRNGAEWPFKAKTYGESCAFLAIDLACGYERRKLAEMTRRLSRLHAVRVCVLFKHGERVSLAIAVPRSDIDALEKITLIHDIAIARPHAGHLATLKLLSRVEPSADVLGKRFYREIANWYFRALQTYDFLANAQLLSEKDRVSFLIRFLTRVIFQEFLKRYIIEHYLHGVDIQPIAIEITHLRFTLSLLCDQRAHALLIFKMNFMVANALTDSNIDANFDIVIGNPPYFKENDDRTRFDGLRDRACYQGKMDLRYMFADVGLDMLRPNGVLAFSATSNWTTSAGASKIRNKIVKDARLIELIDFNDDMIFESARVQTMIMLLSKSVSPASYRASIVRARDGFCAKDILALKTASPNLHRFIVDIDRTKLIDKLFVFNAEDSRVILDLIEKAGDFSLRKEEIGQGIVPNPDRVNVRNIAAINFHTAKARGIEAGDGVFVLDETETRAIDESERVHLKPLYEPVHIDRYFKRPTDLKITYSKKGGFDAEHAPSVVTHLRKFREIMERRRENALGHIAFHHLHWPRKEAFFIAREKILAPRKCVSPMFLYTEDEAYVMLSMNVIRTLRIDMRYLSAVLNSSTIRFWL